MEFNAVYCGWNRDNKIVNPKLEGDLSFELLSGKQLIYTNTIMMWKSIAIDIGGWDERFKRNQEAVFLLKYFECGNKIGVVSKELVQFDISDRSNALNSKGNEEQFNFYLAEHEKNIIKCENYIKDAKKIIYSYRYRGVLLAYLLDKNISGAIRIYIKMMKYIPIRFNKDLFIYIYKKVRKMELYDVN